MCVCACVCLLNIWIHLAGIVFTRDVRSGKFMASASLPSRSTLAPHLQLQLIKLLQCQYIAPSWQ